MSKRLIIINRMYAGKYLTEGENIGHEVINLIRTDDGDNYLWLNADGNCNISYFKDKNGKLIYDEIIMLMVMMYGYRQWKVLAKAVIDTDDLEKYMVPKFGEKYNEAQRKIIEVEHIYYGGKPLDKIFDNNFFNNQIQSGVDIYFTFKAKGVFLPVCTPENSEKTIINIAGLEGLANQSLRMYLRGDKNVETHNRFNAIINGEVFDWEKENTTKKADTSTIFTESNRDYFVKIINEEYRELTFSNLLAYFLSNKKIMACFAKEVLNADDFDAENYSITREEKNIDLFISSSKHYFIIENKIRSSLIRKDKNIENKLKEYFGKDTEGARKLLSVFNSRDYHYQTDRYYAYAKAVVSRQNSEAKIKGYVLFPNYAEHSISAQLKDTLFSKHYEPITYLKVYDFFYKLKESHWLNDTERMYLNEFLWAMEKHTKEIDNSFEEEMKLRFYKRLQQDL